jgi:hypothetical protein
MCRRAVCHRLASLLMVLLLSGIETQMGMAFGHPLLFGLELGKRTVKSDLRHGKQHWNAQL